MSDFNDYMVNKYPTYTNQKKVIETKKDLADLEVQNIERSIKSSKNSNRDSNLSNKSQNDGSKKKKPLKKLVIETPKSAKRTAKEPVIRVTDSAKKPPNGLEGYDLDEFLTSPPVKLFLIFIEY